MSVVLFGVLTWFISARTPTLDHAVRDRARAAGVSHKRGSKVRGWCDRRSLRADGDVLAIWLSLGPLPYAGESRVSGFGLYGLLYDCLANGVRAGTLLP
jgi:hypothetical protein